MLACGQHNLSLCGGLQPEFGGLQPQFRDYSTVLGDFSPVSGAFGLFGDLAPFLGPSALSQGGGEGGQTNRQIFRKYILV